MPRVRGKTAARGYDGQHQRIRAQWKPVVDAGRAYCHAARCLMPSRWIPPGTPWDLGHTTDRTDWTGPEHRRCSRSDGAIRRNQMARQRRRQSRVSTQPSVPSAPLRTSRQW